MSQSSSTRQSGAGQSPIEQQNSGQSPIEQQNTGQSPKPSAWKHWFVIIPVMLALLGGAAGVIIEAVYLADYASHWWNEIPAFYLLFGLGSAVLTLVVTLLLQQVLLHHRQGGNEA
jgi:hypothetical protein